MGRSGPAPRGYKGMQLMKCDISGFIHYANEMRRTFDGKIVHHSRWYPKPDFLEPYPEANMDELSWNNDIRPQTKIT